MWEEVDGTKKENKEILLCIYVALHALFESSNPLRARIDRDYWFFPLRKGTEISESSIRKELVRLASRQNY